MPGHTPPCWAAVAGLDLGPPSLACPLRPTVGGRMGAQRGSRTCPQLPSSFELTDGICGVLMPVLPMPWSLGQIPPARILLLAGQQEGWPGLNGWGQDWDVPVMPSPVCRGSCPWYPQADASLGSSCPSSATSGPLPHFPAEQSVDLAKAPWSQVQQRARTGSSALSATPEL